MMQKETGPSDVLFTQQALLTGDPSSPAAARRLLAGWLGNSSRLEDALLAASELVTNAVRYSNGANDEKIELIFEETPGGFRVEVKQLTIKTVKATGRFPEPDKIKGRGLAVVQAVSDRWGVRYDDALSTTVWFEIDTHLQ
jgi:anti-sigma regulatory factor (Ser/Thr protein kinase)